MAFTSGKHFAHFVIERKLGEGGMGEVYLAEDQKLNRKVALKILQPEFFDNPERLDRFSREAKTAAQISHPNVMSIYDIGVATEEESDQDINYIVMEYIEGEPLNEYLRVRKPDLKEILRIASRIGTGLAAAHKLGIVHRDIKLDNIYLDENQEPKILDFGLAKPVAAAMSGMEEDSTQSVTQAALTREGKILGTVTYMSPEQARGEQVDTRSDVFSFGVLFYKMVTGEFPFAGSDPVSTIAKIIEGRQPPLRKHDENLPLELERIIDKCLQKDPDDRYQDTRDLVVDLRSLRRQFESGISDTNLVTAAHTSGKKKPKEGFLAWLTWPKLIFLGILSIPLLAIVVSVFESSPDSGNLGMIAQTAEAREGALAILGFSNKTGDTELDWLTTGLPEILLTDLSQIGEVRLISRSRVLDCLEEDVSEMSDVQQHKECVLAAKSLGAGTVLSGAFYKLGEKLRIDARLEDVGSGRIILAEKVVGEDPFILVDSLTDKIAVSMQMHTEQLAARAHESQQWDPANTEAFIDSIMRSVDQSLQEAGISMPDRRIKDITSGSMIAYKEYHQGMNKFSKGLHEQARRHFEKAISIDSTFALPYMRIGMSYSFQGKNQQASEYFAQALQYVHNLPRKEQKLLDIYADTWLRSNFDDAFIKIRNFVADYPEDKEARTIYALYLDQIIGDQEAALAQFDTVYTIDEKFPLALMGEAQTYRRRNDYEKAIEIYNRLKSYHPESPDAYEALASIYITLGRYDEAEEEVEALLERFPERHGPFVLLNSIALRQRDFDKARRHLQRIHDLYQDDPYRLSNNQASLANVALWEGEFLRELDHLHRAVQYAKQAGDSSLVHRQYGSIARTYLFLEQEDSALVYVRKSGEWASLFNLLTEPMYLVAMDKSLLPEAREKMDVAFSTISQRVPEEFLQLFEDIKRAFERYAQDDTAQIITAYQSLISRPGQERTANLFVLGELQALTGDYAGAKETLAKLMPGGASETASAYYYAQAVYYLGIAEQELGNSEQAIEYFNEFMEYWGDADRELEMVEDARERLTQLTS